MNSSQQSNYLKALCGDTWEIRDDLSKILAVERQAQKKHLTLSNKACSITWSYDRSEVEPKEIPYFSLAQESSLFLSYEEELENRLSITRIAKDEIFQLTVTTPLDHTIVEQTFTDPPTQVFPGIPCAEPSSPLCSCPECAANQMRISYNPKIHPLFFVLENIAYSAHEFSIRVSGVTQNVCSYFHPHAMRTHQGKCVIYSPECVIQLNITQVFVVRVKKERHEGVVQSILECMDKENRTLCSIYSTNSGFCQTWAKLISQSQLLL